MGLSLPELRSFAMDRHSAQLYGGANYVTHLDAVFDVVRRHGLPGVYERAAYGHDLLDDTLTTKVEVVHLFGWEESELIYSVSGPGANRPARRVATLRRLEAYPPGVDLKVPDRIANLTAALRNRHLRLVLMYLEEEAAYAPYFAQAKQSLQDELETLYTQARALQ
jgi:hypothetical protein